MRITRFLIAFLVLIVAQVFGQATIPCTYTDGATGYIYDLNPLVNNNGDYIVDVQTGTDSQTVVGYRITLNVCRPIFLTACSNQAGANCDACQQWPLDQPNQFQHNNALGSTISTTFGSALDTTGTDHEGVTMYFAGYQSTITMNMICDPGAGKGKPTYVSKPTSTNFLLQWKSKYGCATNGNASSGGSGGSDGLSGGSIMMIIVLVLVVVYLTAGILFQKFKNHAEGTDLIPNKEFWISLPGLVKDGVLFIYHKIRGGNSAYQKF